MLGRAPVALQERCLVEITRHAFAPAFRATEVVRSHLVLGTYPTDVRIVLRGLHKIGPAGSNLENVETAVLDFRTEVGVHHEEENDRGKL